MCDASDLAIEAVLRQREEGKPYVVYYESKTLNEAQRNYTTVENELLAVVYALDKFQAYLVGSDMIIFTDHSALKYVLTNQPANQGQKGCGKCCCRSPIEINNRTQHSQPSNQ